MDELIHTSRTILAYWFIRTSDMNYHVTLNIIFSVKNVDDLIHWHALNQCRGKPLTTHPPTHLGKKIEINCENYIYLPWHMNVRWFLMSTISRVEYIRHLILKSTMLNIACLTHNSFISLMSPSIHGWGGPAVSYRWTGWSWRLQENYRLF